MDLILWTGRSLEKADGCNALSDQEALAFRFSRLSSWMMILGTVRLISSLGDYGNAFLDIAPFSHASPRELTRFFQDNPPAVLLGSSWPLILGILLRKPRSREFLIAGAVTFLILSLGGILNLLASTSVRSSDSMIWIGSFAIGRGLLLRGNLTAAIRALAGAIQLSLELVTAVSAGVLYQSLRTDTALHAPAAASSRRGLYGRLAIYFSLAFIVLNVRQPVWSTYLTVLNQSNLVREFVLRNDEQPRSSHDKGFLAFAPHATGGDLSFSLAVAHRLASSNKLLEAKQAYLGIISRAESLNHGLARDGAGQPQLAAALNNLAWMLTTCEDVELREPKQALEYARKAVELAGDQGTYWNTLGVVCCRLHDWDEAIQALNRSMELRANGEGDGFDWFFLAMIHAGKNQKEEARRWYDRAVTWFHQNQPADPELLRFQVEAAKALNIPGPPLLPVKPLPKPGESLDTTGIGRRVRFSH